MKATKSISRMQMYKKLVRAYSDQYGRVPFILSEEHDGTNDGIKFHEAPEDRDGLPLYDYWAEDYQEKVYTMGQRNHFYNFLERNGWYFEFINSEEGIIRPV